MRIERHRIGTVEIIAPAGALVDEDVEGFVSQLDELVKAAHPRFVVSLHDVPYLDSAAIEALLNAAEELDERAATLKLARVPSTCREILELTGVSDQFSFFTEVQDAVRSFI